MHRNCIEADPKYSSKYGGKLLLSHPIILHGKIYSKAVNQSGNDVIKSNPRLVHQVLANNFPSTGNLWLQTSNNSKSRVVILSNNNLRRSTTRINNYLGDKLRTIGWIKPGALAGNY
jgi:hypothetical protein